MKNPDLFNKVYTTGYSIAWSDELKIDVMTIYAEIVNKNIFIEKIEAGLKDIQEGRALAYKDVKQAFLTKMF